MSSFSSLCTLQFSGHHSYFRQYFQKLLSVNIGQMQSQHHALGHRQHQPYWPHHEKTCCLLMQKQRYRSAAWLPSSWSAPLFCYKDSTIPLLPISEIASLLPSVVVQPGLCRTWSETRKTGFLSMQIIFSRTDRGYFQTIQQQEDFRGVRVTHSPLSMSESTPTYTDYTEGTPSYTASSPSCSSEVLGKTKCRCDRL